jgi:cyanophycinase
MVCLWQLLVPSLLAAVYSYTPGQNVSTTDSLLRVVVGGSLESDSPILDVFKGFPRNGVKLITAAGRNPTDDAVNLISFFAEAGIEAEWIPVYHENCNERTRSEQYVKMVEEASAIYMSGGQSGNLQSCLFGNYEHSGVDGGKATPFLTALRTKLIVGGSSAGAMNQPLSEILVTGHSQESYAVLRAGSVFQRDGGNAFIEAQELVDTHFSERGRQGRMVVLAMQTQQKWAFGVDENTAYVWRSSGDYEVVGATGVVIYENTKGNAAAQQTTMHFLTHGDKINPSTGVITFNPDKKSCSAGSAPSGSSSVFSADNYRTVSIATAKAPVGTRVINYHGAPAVEIHFHRASSTVAMCGPSGTAFSQLAVEQFQSSSFENKEQAGLPLDHMWQFDE